MGRMPVAQNIISHPPRRVFGKVPHGFPNPLCQACVPHQTNARATVFVILLRVVTSQKALCYLLILAWGPHAALLNCAESPQTCSLHE
jgi:hypothetical protein